MRLLTPRLALRPLAATDVAWLHALWSDPDVRRHLGGGKPAPSLDRVRRWVDERVADPAAVLVVEPRDGGGAIGYCGVQPLPETGEPELFYGYAPEAWGRGFATEAGRAVVEHARVALGLASLVAVVRRENPASMRVAEKLGFRATGEMTHAGLPHVRYELALTPA